MGDASLEERYEQLQEQYRDIIVFTKNSKERRAENILNDIQKFGEILDEISEKIEYYRKAEGVSANLENKIEERRKNINELKSERKKLNKRVKAFEANNIVKNNELDDELEKKWEEIKQTQESLDNKIENLQEECESIQKQYNMKMEEISEAEEYLEEFIQKGEECVVDLSNLLANNTEYAPHKSYGKNDIDPVSKKKLDDILTEIKEEDKSDWIN